MTQCAIHGPRRVQPGQAVRVDVVVHDVPKHTPVRIRLEQLVPSPRAHVDEWTAVMKREGMTSVSFVWRATEVQPPETDGMVMLRATVWGHELLSACTHGVWVGRPRRRATARGEGPASREPKDRGVVRAVRNGHPHPLLNQGRGFH